MYDNNKQKLNQHHEFEFLKLTKIEKVRIVATEALLSPGPTLRATANTSSYCVQAEKLNVSKLQSTHNRDPA